MPLPYPSFEPETHRWRPGAVAPSREVPSQICAVLGQKQPFFAQNSPSKGSKTAKRRQTAATLHVRLDFPVTKGPLVPCNSTICPRISPKGRQKGPKTAQCAPTPRNQASGRILGYVAQKRIPRAPSPPATPHFLRFSKPQNRPTRHVDTRTTGHLVQPEGRPAHAQWGPTVGPTRVPRAKKIIFSKVVPRPLGMLKQVFLGLF